METKKAIILRLAGTTDKLIFAQSRILELEAEVALLKAQLLDEEDMMDTVANALRKRGVYGG